MSRNERERLLGVTVLQNECIRLKSPSSAARPSRTMG